MLKLICGVRDHKLREEFLKQKEPTLTQLIQIAERWQKASHVSKDMDGSASLVDARKTSNYKTEKAKRWITNAEEQGHQSQTKDVCGYCGRAGKHN